MYQSWIQDQEDLHKLCKDYALFVGAFSNPKMAHDISKKDNPDFVSSEEDYQKSIESIGGELISPIKNGKRSVQ